MIIEGTLTIPKKLKSLGKIREAGEINASFSKLEDLGDLEEVGILNIPDTPLTSLGKLKKAKWINASDSDLNNLKDLKEVGKLYIQNTPSLTSLGKLTKVREIHGNLILLKIAKTSGIQE